MEEFAVFYALFWRVFSIVTHSMLDPWMKRWNGSDMLVKVFMFFLLLLSWYLYSHASVSSSPPPVFFSLSTIPIVHLYTSLSRSSYPFPHSSLQESGILHCTHFSSHSFSILLPHLHGVSWVHAIPHFFAYPLKPLT